MPQTSGVKDLQIAPSTPSVDETLQLVGGSRGKLGGIHISMFLQCIGHRSAGLYKKEQI